MFPDDTAKVLTRRIWRPHAAKTIFHNLIFFAFFFKSSKAPHLKLHCFSNLGSFLTSNTCLNVVGVTEEKKHVEKRSYNSSCYFCSLGCWHKDRDLIYLTTGSHPLWRYSFGFTEGINQPGGVASQKIDCLSLTPAVQPCTYMFV